MSWFSDRKYKAGMKVLIKNHAIAEFGRVAILKNHRSGCGVYVPSLQYPDDGSWADSHIIDKILDGEKKSHLPQVI